MIKIGLQISVVLLLASITHLAYLVEPQVREIPDYLCKVVQTLARKVF